MKRLKPLTRGNPHSTSQPAVVKGADRQLAKLEDRLDQRVPKRPWWQRFMLPLLGLVLVVTGIPLSLTPFPGSLMVVAGIPLLFCFHQRLETKIRRWLVGRLEALRRWLRSWRKSPQGSHRSSKKMLRATVPVKTRKVG